MRKIIVDVDYTISLKTNSYENAIPHKQMIEKMKQLKSEGFYIVLYTARNMKTYNGDLHLILENTKPVLIEWLVRNDVPFDELILGKPWNDEGYYVDDNAIRPSEFLALTHEEIVEMLDEERKNLWKL